MFCKDEEVKGLFKKSIFFVTVSQNGNVDLVVKQLSECMGSRAPTFQNDVHRSQWIQTFFNEREEPFLLVLDDIWSGSELILQSFQSDKSNYKILVTSRSEFPRFGSSYKLQLLDDGNAMKLFYHSASLGIEYSGYLEALSKKIVKRCNGFPLAITVIGRSLSRQPIEVWRKRDSEWSNGASILDSETKLFLCHQSSLDALDKEFKLVKDCYLDLGAFPEDTKIRVDVMIDMWTELYDLDDDSVLTNIYALGNRNLATLVDERSRKMEGEDFYSNRFVTQHDLLRELATYNTKLGRLEQRERVFIEMLSEKNIPKWWRREQIYRPKKARLLSLTSDRGDSSERRRVLSVIYNREYAYDRDRDNWPNMQLPEVMVLVFNVIKSDGYTALPKFVEKLQKLKVAVIQAHDPYSKLANFELLSSLRNLKRINLSGIGEFPTIKKGVRFTSVRKLSLYRCMISCLDPFDNMSHGLFNQKENMSYAFPNLKEMNIDYCGYFGETPAAFYSLVQLKVLTINNSDFGVSLPEEIGNLVNLEVLRVRNCYALKKIPSSIIKKLRKLNFLDTSGCFIESWPDFIGELKSLRKLDMRHCQYISALPPSVSDLHRLEEVICDEYNADQWRTVLPKLKNLRRVVTK